MKNGIYALASLDGRPLASRDLAVMGLADDAPGVRSAPGCLSLAQDVRASAIHARSGAEGIDTLLGDLDEPGEAARAVGLPPSTDPLAIVLASVERFGEEAAARLFGSWLLARWDARAATMTLLMAQRVRDTCYVATDGRYVALSPELARLARLDWVDAAPDPTNLLLSVGRARLRRSLGNRTFLRDVVRVLPATRVTVRAAGLDATAPQLRQVPPMASAIGIDEAVEQLDLVLRRVIRRHFDREGDSAVSLSGGLDSSIIALYAARERGDRRLTLLTSAAPPGSGLADETGLAGTVASHLGLSIEKVAPPIRTDIYRPSRRILAMNEAPLASPRHYLDEAVERAARDHGAAALLSGFLGEMTITHHGVPYDLPGRVRVAVRRARARLKAWRAPFTAADALHIRAAAGVVARSAAFIDDVWRNQPNPDHPLDPRGQIGISSTFAETDQMPSWSTTPSLRIISPFFDQRLVDCTAALPLAFTQEDGRNRALARRLLRGSLPDSIALQPKGSAYSPAYYVMLTEQAGAERHRLRELAQEGVGDWIDVAWLDRTLCYAESTTLNLHMAYQLQMSLMLAEFLTWWGSQTRPAPPT